MDLGVSGDPQKVAKQNGRNILGPGYVSGYRTIDQETNLEDGEANEKSDYGMGRDGSDRDRIDGIGFSDTWNGTGRGGYQDLHGRRARSSARADGRWFGAGIYRRHQAGRDSRGLHRIQARPGFEGQHLAER